ncbi:hypothetical protein EON65_30375 [archaeon]|nr:MAG: hypothetical protein EON65_30375 [archaeon]
MADTSLPLLVATILASMLHLYFEVLAFQSDIAYWRKADRPAGISHNSLIFALTSRVVVFLYLFQNDTSMIVIVPAFFGILIQIWKVMKARGVHIAIVYGILPVLKYNETNPEMLSKPDASISKEETDGKDTSLSRSNDKDGSVALNTLVGSSAPSDSPSTVSNLERFRQASAEADQFAYSLLTTYMTPLLLAWCIYSLVYEKHLSWISFVLTSFTGFIYAFGFVFMFPQLYINHKLKSVAHLPWAMLVYKFVNTFIDGKCVHNVVKNLINFL